MRSLAHPNIVQVRGSWFLRMHLRVSVQKHMVTDRRYPSKVLAWLPFVGVHDARAPFFPGNPSNSRNPFHLNSLCSGENAFRCNLRVKGFLPVARYTPCTAKPDCHSGGALSFKDRRDRDGVLPQGALVGRLKQARWETDARGGGAVHHE